MPPTGKRMEVDEMFFLRVKEGRIVEYWAWRTSKMNPYRLTSLKKVLSSPLAFSS
jgi:hypothetical protein